MHKLLRRLASKGTLTAAGLFVLPLAGAHAAPWPAGVQAGQWFKTCSSATHCITQYRTQTGILNSFAVVTGGSRRGPLAVAIVSPDAILPFGVTWKIDQQKQFRVPFIRCNGATCVDQLIINDRYLDALRTGSVLHLGVRQDRGSVHTISINLKGFASVYDGR